MHGQKQKQYPVFSDAATDPLLQVHAQYHECIVGTGLPQICNERELIKYYYDSNFNRSGFQYGYLYPAINKVLQADGRVIRTVNDTGIILLLDERFQMTQYTSLFPAEWQEHYSY